MATANGGAAAGHPVSCAAAILCGGKSSRMGFDKAFLKAPDGRLLLEHHADLLSGLFGTVALISNNRAKLAAYPALSAFPVYEDAWPGMGPLGGICTAMCHVKEQAVFAMACDMPAPSAALIAQMQAALPGHDVSLCAHGEKLEPMFAFYAKSCLPVFQRQLAENRPQLRREFGQLRVATTHVDETTAAAAFLNLNTQEDWEKWRKRNG